METGIVIAEHADLTDTAQTVGVGVDVPVEETKEPTTPAPESGTSTGAKTGREGLPVGLLVVAIVAGAAAVMLVIRRKKRSANSK